MNFFIKKLYILFTFLSVLSNAQELPPIVKYPSSLYNAGNQNWMISQDKNSFVFFANNEGLLEFNGSNWNLYPSPNETIIRSVKVVGDRVYTGCYMEFGFWKRQANGLLHYTSISKNIKSKLIEDEHFWNIVAVDHWVLFQSFNRIYIYNTKDESFNFIDDHSYLFRCYNVDSSIFFQAIGEGLYEIVNGKSILISDDSRIRNNRIVEIFKDSEGILLQTERAGIFRLEKKVLSKFHFISEEEIERNTVFSAQKLSHGGFALGTISNGIYILDANGKIENHITQNTGISNNTILSIKEDSDHNLWLGLDNGIDCINLQSPIKKYKDDAGYLGTVYASVKYKDKIYLGTNQGLFWRNTEENSRFNFITGTKGQVWTLFEYDDQLFCGHDLGTFTIDGDKAKLIYNESGTWEFNIHPNNKDILIQGNYNGLSVLEKTNGGWRFKNKIKGFDISSRYFEITNDNIIYVGHEYKGLLKVEPDKDISEVIHFTILPLPKKGKNIGLVKYNGIIYFIGKEGVYQLNPKTKEFEKDIFLSQILVEGGYISGKVSVDQSNKMWFFTKNAIYYVTSGNFDSQLRKHKISIPFTITNPMAGYENIAQIGNNKYLIGKTDGYFIINLSDFKVKSHSVILNSVSVSKLEKAPKYVSLSQKTVLHNSENNIVFNYSVPQYDRFIDVMYQYQLEGFQEKWSNWTTKSNMSFKNLSPGNYIFRVKAKVANIPTINTIEYQFEIKRPWYATYLAWTIYAIILLILAYYINKAYHNYYRKKEQKLIEENNLLLEIAALESEQQMIKLRNEQLVQDVDAKNKELAVSNMSLIKKDELLAIIKEDLKKSAENIDSKNLKSVISTISKNINKDDSWNTFKESFDNLDKDFLKRIKLLHPNLTPSDLKLCAYLRLNLSSKEIAPMLNISIRSVEIKRYRLRKKLNLMHDNGLVDYILSV
ncbi:LuxR family transcriptional regulator [Flavobacterium sp. NRK F10]|uniref:triple tyrosine motif-containing protein n=1 Tax=Flavobacterium sp. NRK F10 TaxID=2954931 RepID=UPI002090DD8D|nr:triple tyrosine motif-containing protein [Flavobacterium sp. NRK F10]MCO6176007.1 LuxR family transcriptional regulator [Flavobacterium sp. NRK F10]